MIPAFQMEEEAVRGRIPCDDLGRRDIIGVRGLDHVTPFVATSMMLLAEFSIS